MNVISRNKAQRIAVQAALKMGLRKENVRPHELILAAKLTTADNDYTISLEDNKQKAILSWAEGLKDRDAFIAIGMAMGVLPVKKVSGTEYPTASLPVYHPDPNVFAEAAGSATLSEAEAVTSLWVGRHTLKTNEGNRIDKQPNLHFLTIQETQASASTANMVTGMELKEIGAAVRFGGGDLNEIIIHLNCPDKTHIAGTAARQNYILIRLCGAVIKGGTNKTYLG